MEIKTIRTIVAALSAGIAWCVGAPFTWEAELGGQASSAATDAGPQIVDTDAGALVAPALGDAVTLTKVEDAGVATSEAAIDAPAAYPDAAVTPPPPVLSACAPPTFIPYWLEGFQSGLYPGPYPDTLFIESRVGAYSANILPNNYLPGTFIYFTTDGSEPTYESAVFDYNRPLDVTGPMVVRAFVDGPGTCSPSRIATATITSGDGGVLDLQSY
jgi:hypothetical protein